MTGSVTTLCRSRSRGRLRYARIFRERRAPHNRPDKRRSASISMVDPSILEFGNRAGSYLAFVLFASDFAVLGFGAWREIRRRAPPRRRTAVILGALLFVDPSTLGPRIFAERILPTSVKSSRAPARPPRHQRRGVVGRHRDRARHFRSPANFTSAFPGALVVSISFGAIRVRRGRATPRRSRSEAVDGPSTATPRRESPDSSSVGMALHVDGEAWVRRHAFDGLSGSAFLRRDRVHGAPDPLDLGAPAVRTRDLGRRRFRHWSNDLESLLTIAAGEFIDRHSKLLCHRSALWSYAHEHHPSQPRVRAADVKTLQPEVARDARASRNSAGLSLRLISGYADLPTLPAG